MSVFLLLSAILLYTLGGYLLFNVVYLVLFSIAGHWKTTLTNTSPIVASGTQRICVLMPAYQADDVIRETAPLAVHHQYIGQFDVHVIADGLQPATVQALRHQGAKVIEVSFVKSTKGKALLTALNSLPTNAYDVAVILDVDNVMGTGFLNQVDHAMVSGSRVVQGHRTAKNLDSPFAVLDACNEEINNHIFRQGHVSLGMSSALIGSGMAFDYHYLHRLLQDIGETPGEDKELEFKILRNKIKIDYLATAHVYDEKIPNSQVFTAQRTRWLAAQQEFLRKYFLEGLWQLGRGNFDFTDKVIQVLLLPRILLLGLLVIFAGLSVWWAPGPGLIFWFSLLFSTIIALLLALPKRLYTRQVVKALLYLPVALGAMLLALLQIRKAKTSFMHTPHTASTQGSPSSLL